MFIAHFKLLKQVRVIFISSLGGHPEDFVGLGKSVVCLTMSLAVVFIALEYN